MSAAEQEDFRPFGHPGKYAFRCTLCKDYGDVIATLKGTYQVFAFKCSCEAGERSKKAFPLWPGENAGFTIEN